MTNPETIINWEKVLAGKLAAFGHRNWIVVADSAYPLQSHHGIETVVAGADHIEVVKTVLAAIDASEHVRAKIYIDHELEFVGDKDAPGIAKFREDLKKCFEGSHIDKIAHEEIITNLHQAAQMFQILILKTPLTLPYTSVFFRLGCGYWNESAEHKLRNVIASRL